MWKTIFIVLSASLQTLSLNTNETEGELFLEKYNDLVATLWNEDVKAAWNYYTNLTTENLQIMTDSSLKTSEFAKNIATVNASAFDWTRFGNDTRRKFQKIVSIGFAATNDTEKLRQISSLEAELTSIYSTGEVCLNEFGKGCLQLEPGLTDIITTSRDYEELLAVWKGWRDATGKKMRNKYTQFVNVMNDAIKFSGYKDTGEYWRSWYETPSFEDDVRKLYEELAPLYQELHAYVRRKLMNKYGEALFPKTGHIPAHLFGNMWAQQWSNVFDLLVPYPDASSVDITAKMKELGYNETYMYRVAEEFFESIGMDPMTSEFWENSMLVKPEGRNVVCHASAWDFYDGKDFRIKQCTSVTEDQLLTVHHEMGHIVYFQNYKVQPRIYRSGANPGFHEGMADIVSLSFQTPEHMKAIGLIDEIPEDDKSDINFLMKMALDKVAFLPFGYLIDQWRWSVFRGETNTSNYNANWWDLRCSFQGISPPVLRSEEDFDAGAKYHIPGNTPYIRYFVSFIIQFQWHKALCDEINYTGPLHRCDIYRNKTAGDLLKKMLVMGSSKPWQDAMEVMTGERVMSAQPLMNYFAPLLTWLKEQNKQENIGWSSSCPTALPTPTSMPIIPSSSSVIGSCKFLLFILFCLLADLIC